MSGRKKSGCSSAISTGAPWQLTCLAVVVMAMFAIASPAYGAPATPQQTAYMSCGWPPTSGYGIESSGSISYRVHPPRCFYSDDGTTVHLINLVGLQWSGWGSREARAKGKLVDNHDQDRNGFQRRRVRVALSGLRPAVGHQGLRKIYYTKLRLVLASGQSFTESLYRPGQGVVRLGSGSAFVNARTTGQPAGVGQAPCTRKQIFVNFYGTQPAAGTRYSIFQVVNNGGKSCSIEGFPRLIARGFRGEKVFSKRDTYEAAHLVSIAPGGRAEFTAHYPQPSFLPAGQCHPTKAANVTVFLPRIAQGYPLRFREPICAHPRHSIIVGPIGGGP